jgi:TonB family protein
MTEVTDITRGSLRIGLLPSASTASDEWKKFIGQQPVAARLSTLPEKRMRWSALVTSTGAQVVVAAILVALPIFFPEKLVTHIAYEVTPLTAFVTEVPLPAKPEPVRAKVEPAPPPEAPPPTHVAKLLAPTPLVAPRPNPVKEQPQEPPKIEPVLTAAKFDAPSAEPIRPREPIKTGMLNTGSSAAVTVNKPVETVQTGGFGDPHGLAGEAIPNKAANAARTGSFDLPTGPGYGNGTGGASGFRGTVASTGFGNGVAIVPKGNSSRTAVQAGGFATAAQGSDTPAKPKAAETAPAIQPIVILDKPNPIYSAEARKLGIEGEVQVEVIFRASGQVQTTRVVKGLGHGLDEAAIHAAEQIRFKPAIQDGHAVDFPAIVHIVFQLAF